MTASGFLFFCPYYMALIQEKWQEKEKEKYHNSKLALGTQKTQPLKNQHPNEEMGT
jgi:hypothetical protein